MFRIFNLGKCALLILLLLAAVGLQAQDTTLTFISWQVDEPGVGDWWRTAIEEFESRHEGVTIEFTKVARPEYADTFLTLFAGGTPPDIVHLAAFEFQQFADAGWLEDLAPWVENSELSLDGWAGQVKCQWEGETSCIMLLYFGFVMVVNDAILESIGHEAPTNWDEMLAVLRAATQDTDGDGIVDQWGVCHHTNAGSQYASQMLSYVVGSGGYWTSAEGEVTINTPEVQEGFRRWKMVFDEGLSPLDLSSGDCHQLMMEGKLATRMEGSWVYNFVRRAERKSSSICALCPCPLPCQWAAAAMSSPWRARSAMSVKRWSGSSSRSSPHRNGRNNSVCECRQSRTATGHLDRRHI